MFLLERLYATWPWYHRIHTPGSSTCREISICSDEKLSWQKSKPISCTVEKEGQSWNSSFPVVIYLATLAGGIKCYNLPEVVHTVIQSGWPVQLLRLPHRGQFNCYGCRTKASSTVTAATQRPVQLLRLPYRGRFNRYGCHIEASKKIVHTVVQDFLQDRHG